MLIKARGTETSSIIKASMWQYYMYKKKSGQSILKIVLHRFYEIRNQYRYINLIYKISTKQTFEKSIRLKMSIVNVRSELYIIMYCE